MGGYATIHKAAEDNVYFAQMLQYGDRDALGKCAIVAIEAAQRAFCDFIPVGIIKQILVAEYSMDQAQSPPRAGGHAAFFSKSGMYRSWRGGLRSYRCPTCKGGARRDGNRYLGVTSNLARIGA